jgi:hypothetical protein
MQVGIAVDNTVPLHIPSFIQFIDAHSQAIRCRAISAPLRFSQSPIDYQTESAKLSRSVRNEIQENDSSLLVTALPFADNYFYRGSDDLTIISFSDWHLSTTLPMSNGLAYFLCQIISKYELNIGSNHDQTTGCINDFLWDKAAIDVGMRAAFICDKCRTHSADNTRIDSQEFADVIAILNAVSVASRKGVDILSELSTRAVAQPTPFPPARFDVFLCHNSQDKEAVRRLNGTLKNGGIRTWLDEEQIQPGEIWQDKLEAIIPSIPATLVIVGDSGIGPWQDQERRAFINEFANRGCRIIPVVIGNAAQIPQLPLFLRQFMWSDLRGDDGSQVAKIISALR